MEHKTHPSNWHWYDRPLILSSHMEASAQVYTKSVVKYFYDIVVLGFINRYAWRCDTRRVLLPLFQENVGKGSHLDVGVGSGYYPAHSVSKFAETKNVTLFDLNPNTLEGSKARLLAAGYDGTVDTVERSIFEPLPAELRGRFSSISTFYLLHCLPGSFPEKGSRVFGNLAAGLVPGGVLYGATVLGWAAPHNFLSTRWMHYVNGRGSFDNADDTLEGLEKALKGCFDEVEIRTVGVVALFKARAPKAK